MANELSLTTAAGAVEEAIADTRERAAPPADRENSAEVERWFGWAMLALERLPVPYPLLVGSVGLLGLGEQVLEHYLYDPSFSSLTAATVRGWLVFPILAVYILTHLRILKKAAVNALAQLRPSVLIEDEEYERHVYSIVNADWRAELALLALSTTVVLALFVGLDADLLSSPLGLPDSLPLAIFVAASYVLLGWLLLTLVYCGIRQAYALRRLARRPLVVNVFDPANLVPFGRLALIHSLPSVGVLLVPLVLLGPPTQAGYLVIFLSIVSLLALFVPLWGVHQQIDGKKEQVLAEIYEQLTGFQHKLLGDGPLETDELEEMVRRTSVLTDLRDLIQQSPNWPFKDTTAVVRAIIAVTSPLAYFVLNEIIRVYLLPMLTLGGA